MNKILIAALAALSINTVAAAAGKRPNQGDDYSVEIHKECFLHPVIVKQVEVNDLSSEDFDILIQIIQDYIDDLTY